MSKGIKLSLVQWGVGAGACSHSLGEGQQPDLILLSPGDSSMAPSGFFPHCSLPDQEGPEFWL